MSCLGGCISKEVWDRAEAMEDAMLDFANSDRGLELLKLYRQSKNDKDLDLYYEEEDKYLKSKGFD